MHYLFVSSISWKPRIYVQDSVRRPQNLKKISILFLCLLLNSFKISERFFSNFRGLFRKPELYGLKQQIQNFLFSKLRQDWDRNFMCCYIFFTTSCQPTAIFVCHVNTTIPLYPFFSSLALFITHSGTFEPNSFQISNFYIHTPMGDLSLKSCDIKK